MLEANAAEKSSKSFVQEQINDTIASVARALMSTQSTKKDTSTSCQTVGAAVKKEKSFASAVNTPVPPVEPPPVDDEWAKILERKKIQRAKIKSRLVPISALECAERVENGMKVVVEKEWCCV